MFCCVFIFITKVNISEFGMTLIRWGVKGLWAFMLISGHFLHSSQCKLHAQKFLIVNNRRNSINVVSFLTKLLDPLGYMLKFS